MYKKILYFFFLLLLLSCSSSDKEIKVKKTEKILPAPFMYKKALEEYDNGKNQKAVDILEIIQNHYSYTLYAPKSLLMISYIYYDVNEYIKSLENLKKFIKLYPKNKNTAYAEFLIGMCLYEQINSASRDTTPAILALKQLNKIINNYPKSIYAEEARYKIDLIKEQLAANEMYIGRFYIKKEKWISAILRFQTVIEKYPKTIFITEALHRMVEINYKIGNIDAAKKYAAILGYNFNNSDWYKKTYKIVEDKNYQKINKDRKKSFKDKLFSIFIFNKDD